MPEPRPSGDQRHWAEQLVGRLRANRNIAAGRYRRAVSSCQTKSGMTKLIEEMVLIVKSLDPVRKGRETLF
jgi:hypothetical protein